MINKRKQNSLKNNKNSNLLIGMAKFITTTLICLMVLSVFSEIPVSASRKTPFYGIWCHASKERSEAEKGAKSLRNEGFDAEVFVTTDWSNLNKEKWYVVSAGTYSTEKKANRNLKVVKEVYPDAYVKFSGKWQGDSEDEDYDSDYDEPTPFYGIWCHASKKRKEAEKGARSLRNEGFDAEVFVTTDWSNLNKEKWYVVSAGVYSTRERAKADLDSVKDVYPDAYIKYSGEWQGESEYEDYDSDYDEPTPFYGIWCHASKKRKDAEKGAKSLREYGFDADVYVTTDWSNLNQEKWYVVSAGEYSTKKAANNNLESVQDVYPDAYVKYTGEWQGN